VRQPAPEEEAAPAAANRWAPALADAPVGRPDLPGDWITERPALADLLPDPPLDQATEGWHAGSGGGWRHCYEAASEASDTDRERFEATARRLGFELDGRVDHPRFETDRVMGLLDYPAPPATGGVPTLDELTEGPGRVRARVCIDHGDEEGSARARAFVSGIPAFTPLVPLLEELAPTLGGARHRVAPDGNASTARYPALDPAVVEHAFEWLREHGFEHQGTIPAVRRREADRDLVVSIDDEYGEEGRTITFEAILHADGNASRR